MTDLSISIKRDVIKQEITSYEATKYLSEVRYRVAKKLQDAGQMEAIQKDLARYEVALDVLNEELKTLETANGKEPETDVKKLEGQTNG